MRARVTAVTTLTAIGLLVSGCQGDDNAPEQEQLTVLAASSLTESFTTIGQQFETDNPGVDVSISFGSSSTLATQVVDGAAADVIATASPGSIEPVVDAGMAAADPTVFATNSVAVALPADNPADIKELADLEDSDVKVAVCVDTAPCGSVAGDMFDAADLSVTPVTEEVDVKSVLAKVVAGEVDAGVVYVSDVLAAGDDVTSVKIPGSAVVTTDYLIAPLTSSTNSAFASEFVDAVTSPDGQQVLAEAGFNAP
jgi:molybdate transport system substrate-binding protein